MKLDLLKKNLRKYKGEILSKTIEVEPNFTEEDIMDTLCFSFSDIITDFIYDNKDKECFSKEINGEYYLGNIDKYMDNVIYYWKTEAPFCNVEPIEFFNTLREEIK